MEFTVAIDPGSDRVWVACKDFSLVRKSGEWTPSIPSADDLKDNFEPVEGKEATTLSQEAAALVSSNPSLSIAALKAS